MPLGALVDPMGTNNESLTQAEYDGLRQLLGLLRQESPSPTAEAIIWLLRRSQTAPGSDAGEVLDSHIWHFMQEDGSFHGLLWSPYGKDGKEALHTAVTDGEFEELEDTLTALRTGA
jgi:hypothetical protein